MYRPRPNGFLARILLYVGLAAFSGCASTYYDALEKLGYEKRDLLVDRVKKTVEAQTEAKEQFTSALDHFLKVTKVDGGELEQKYNELSGELKRSEERAKDVRDRIASVKDVADALFNEWKGELGQYSNSQLRAESERELDSTKSRYQNLMRLMNRSADRMDPVLATFRDQVLFLKHNLNARALASLGTTDRDLRGDIDGLIRDMEASIRESEAFVQGLQPITAP
jgi:type I site-specific restriction endonuclease